LITSRREFLQIGVSAMALPLAAQAASGAGPGTSPSIPLHAVVYDTRFAASINFARQSEFLGLSTRAIEGDMTALWYEEIYHRWQQEPIAIAGLTAHAAMFCFAQLGRDHRLRLVFHAEHRPEADHVDHALSGPMAMLTDASRLETPTSDFGRRMAEIVTRCPRGRSEMASARLRSPGRIDPGSAAPALYSWVLAPAVRA
jgi:hypothetical protein